MANERYKDKPLLRFLELYVLDAIGKLEEKDRTLLEQMTPKLCETFGTKGTWKQAIEKAMKFASHMPSLIAENWEKELKTRQRAKTPTRSSRICNAIRRQQPHAMRRITS